MSTLDTLDLGHRNGGHVHPGHPEPGHSIGEAAALRQVSVRTVRRWISTGRLPAQLVPGPRGPEYRIPAAALSTLNLSTVDTPTLDTGNGRHVHPVNGSATLPAPDELLRKALDREAALLQENAGLRRAAEEAAYLRERLEAADRERAALLADRRQADERHAEAERELRVLLLRAQETAAALTARLEERTALPAPESHSSPAGRSWWRWLLPARG